MSKNSKKTDTQTQQPAPVETKVATTDVTEVDSELTTVDEPIAVTPDMSPDTLPNDAVADKVAKVTVSSNVPKSPGAGQTNVNAPMSQYVVQVMGAVNRFVSVANDPEHSIEDFNRAKINMSNMLNAAIRYQDGNEFVGAMNALLEIVRNNRNKAFHESIFNMYVPWLDMTHTRSLELSRIVAVFQLLTSSDSKTISKAVDFNTVFPSIVDEQIIGRFRNWAVRKG